MNTQTQQGQTQPLWLRELARDIHYAMIEDGCGGDESPAENSRVREAIIRAISMLKPNHAAAVERLNAALGEAFKDDPANAVRAHGAVLPLLALDGMNLGDDIVERFRLAVRTLTGIRQPPLAKGESRPVYAEDLQTMRDVLRALERMTVPVESLGRSESEHPDDIAVDRFAAEMKAKLAAARAKGRGGWDDDEDLQQHLSNLLREHVEKGDPRDVANFCCFLWNRGEPIQPAAGASGIAGEVVEIGDGADGQPRILIHTTREAIKAGPAMLFRNVDVVLTGAKSTAAPGALSVLQMIAAETSDITPTAAADRMQRLARDFLAGAPVPRTWVPSPWQTTAACEAFASGGQDFRTSIVRALIAAAGEGAPLHHAAPAAPRWTENDARRLWRVARNHDDVIESDALDAMRDALLGMLTAAAAPKEASHDDHA